MKKIMGEYAYPIIIIIGFSILVLISWLYNQLKIEDASIFWASVLPSAFVDVISLVVSTILITKIIDRKKIFNEKSKLYRIIKRPHKRLINLILQKYKYLIMNKHDTHFTKDLPENNFMFQDLAPYFKENVHKDFQKDIIIIKKNYFEQTEDGVMCEYVKDEEVMRLTLMIEYQQQIKDVINKFMNEYSSILTTEYLVILVEIKEELNSNPLGVYSFFGDDEFSPIIINVEEYIINNQTYLDSVLKLKRYFDDIDVQAAWDDENDKNNEWGIIGIGISIFFIAFILIKLGKFLISL
ncbi:hypothetical protein FJQ98_19300 [Lysinibacillus agricola]|uniref:Uncharacterized protein n=1 Tax=Lysinibacillus agricola TaxID=2590012 RepID=A0ABX7AN17_9BACI|nr:MULTISPECIES: hypothetical protein [Lysinibacillus]KOS61958.1 hypothetical protein AN161_15525 [Lysinibacillus sp. FJAT-14222]QQP11341.1 hypothetical protein FJQ98_19300 [Lysinibacillus agricola]